MKIVAFHPEAEAEARHVAVAYEFVRSGLGEDFRAELKHTLDRVEKNPLMYALVADLVRFAPVQRFPYSLIYQDDADMIRIIAVAHHHRRPGYWSDRTS